ncbi:hypothetical protein BOO69_02725 [Sulfitobacter alexandrii]|uniref:TIR domain-containing protein n=1 Tax=Sulfitobacter alexandrii TaxID=1917485 RepID=A0A1J0WDS4_9RHOB|nr:TIR domain-containing protein [Sulfitobacter alexandrii]APE42451.1 hypothetical protein BOO69_02725 [Sulfitobacter alexandrii]
MPHDLSVLSPSEFEALSADLIGQVLGVRFEQFGEGADGGIDGRYVEDADGVTILQSKRYEKSAIAALKREMNSERAKIDRLAPTRYILSTSVSMTPGRKQSLMEICGPTVRTSGDIFGWEDIEALLRKFPEVEEAYPALWVPASGAALERLLNRALDGREQRQVPQVLHKLLPKPATGADDTNTVERDTLFLIGASSVHDQFLLWLGPKLEAHGYRVFSELLTLEPGARWHRETGAALEHRAVKVLAVAAAATGADDGAMDLIDRAKTLSKKLDDSRLIIPLRYEEGAKIDGLRDATPTDFTHGWAEGLVKLLDALRRQGIRQQPGPASVAPQWDSFRKRGAIPLVAEPEPLVSNWVQILEMPDEVHFYEVSGAVREDTLKRRIKMLPFPAAQRGRGLITFATPPDVEESLEGVAKLRLRESASIASAAEDGMPEIELTGRDLSNVVTGLLRDAWERHCRTAGMVAYAYSGGDGFHVSPDQAAIGERVPWGKQGARRSSMLRNIAKKHVWSYGVTAIPRNWPFWHFRLKARVLFAKDNDTAQGEPINDSKTMHRLRRSGCKGWRNKQWHGRLLAFLQVMSGDSAFIRVSLAPGQDMLLSSEPLLFTSPVSTALPDSADPDTEEEDASTLGRPETMDEDADGESA